MSVPASRTRRRECARPNIAVLARHLIWCAPARDRAHSNTDNFISGSSAAAGRSRRTFLACLVRPSCGSHAPAPTYAVARPLRSDRCRSCKHTCSSACGVRTVQNSQGLKPALSSSESGSRRTDALSCAPRCRDLHIWPYVGNCCLDTLFVGQDAAEGNEPFHETGVVPACPPPLLSFSACGGLLEETRRRSNQAVRRSARSDLARDFRKSARRDQT